MLNTFYVPGSVLGTPDRQDNSAHLSPRDRPLGGGFICPMMTGDDRIGSPCLEDVKGSRDHAAPSANFANEKN